MTDDLPATQPVSREPLSRLSLAKRERAETAALESWGGQPGGWELAVFHTAFVAGYEAALAEAVPTEILRHHVGRATVDGKTFCECGAHIAGQNYGAVVDAYIAHLVEEVSRGA